MTYQQMAALSKVLSKQLNADKAAERKLRLIRRERFERLATQVDAFVARAARRYESAAVTSLVLGLEIETVKAVMADHSVTRERAAP